MLSLSFLTHHSITMLIFIARFQLFFVGYINRYLKSRMNKGLKISSLKLRQTTIINSFSQDRVCRSLSPYYILEWVCRSQHWIIWLNFNWVINTMFVMVMQLFMGLKDHPFKHQSMNTPPFLPLSRSSSTSHLPS